MQTIPSLVTKTITDVRPRVRTAPFVPGDGIVIKSTVVDAGSAPTTFLRPGLVLVLNTSDGLYYLADGTTGDRNGPASVSSTGTGDASWNSATVTITLDGGVSFNVSLGAATATAAAAVTDLNNNAVFAANCIADVNATFVRIRTRRGGQHVTLAVSSSANTFVGAGVTLTGQGSDADYRVLEEFVDMLDSTGAAQNNAGATSLVGYYSKAKLYDSTPEALAVLARRGSILVA